ncbi:hypothetical protein QBC47DRAFT_463072 [Echria macrotheca]|uniref:Uncharacterized protein n=1 Tax=Echria macrotheca TaxID=438768 RepID=A0AAJ0F6L9_9PEZI|nr:hypothetical protein QBC47DRAFT_463072 [Echria macrotheca]
MGGSRLQRHQSDRGGKHALRNRDGDDETGNARDVNLLRRQRVQTQTGASWRLAEAMQPAAVLAGQAPRAGLFLCKVLCGWASTRGKLPRRFSTGPDLVGWTEDAVAIGGAVVLLLWAGEGRTATGLRAGPWSRDASSLEQTGISTPTAIRSPQLEPKVSGCQYKTTNSHQVAHSAANDGESLQDAGHSRARTPLGSPGC